MIARLMGLATIKPAELHALQQRGAAMAIDVNSRASWMKAHVPGALSLDHSAFEAADLPVDRGATLVFYCSNPLCRKAPLAARRAIGLGYRDVRVMSAGIAGWIDAALPTDAGPA
jgi:rhodanese-related sulfurtransferase